MNKVKIGALLMGLLLWGGLSAQAQIGEHRNDFSIGFTTWIGANFGGNTKPLSSL